MPHAPKKRNWYLFVASVLIVTTLAVPLANLLLPHLYRHLQLNKLTSDNADIRAAGQTYLMRRAAVDPKVVAGAIDRLDVADERIFLELVITLDQLGYWTRDRVSLDAWLRWLSVVAKDSDPEERVRVTQLVADLPEHAADPRVLELFQHFASDAEAVVRYNALIGIAEMRGALIEAGKTDAAGPYVELIGNMTGDNTPLIARHAWLLLGLIDVSPKLVLTADHLTQPDVGEALLWVSMRSGNEVPAAVIQALESATASPRIRAMAAYTLGLSPGSQGRDALLAFLDQGPRAVNDDNQIAFWRAILSLPLQPRQGILEPGKAPPATDDPGYAALVRFLSKCQREDYENVNLRPLILACLFRDRWLLVDAAIKQSDIVTIADDPVAWLACVEGVPLAYEQKRGPRSNIGPPADVHEQIRLAMLRAMAQPTVDDLLPLFLSEKSTIRDQACIIAVDRLPADQIALLIRRLMQPVDLKGDPLKPVYRYHDGAKLSAAMLSGMTGQETALLQRMAVDFADRAGIIEIIQLALWMQKLPVPGIGNMQTRAEQLLARDDLPYSTVLLALLHQREPVALERLLTPRGDQQPRLLPLLDEDRWWFVVEHYLPKDAPRLWVWADNELARFQLDLLRNWYVVNRYRLRKITSPRREAASPASSAAPR